ncbi:Hpt domain-containing protein [Palleronia sp. KMU-117]|uniref:Hpt domain-containing protein n=1 Tax=Palleronia sp. KMU-117 TaxID=3434108 RepID=UPI003D70B189
MINWDRVNELRHEVGDDDFAEVVTIFLDEVESVMHRMRGATSLESYREDLHFLKGSALNLGFRALGALCHEGQAPTGGDPAALAAHLAEVLRIYDRSKAEFLASAEP